jgi:hydroxyacylglutathione hydrolase
MSDPFIKTAKNLGGVPTVSPKDVQDCANQCKIVDVRRPDEFTGELGHIGGATLSTLETDFEKFIGTLSKDPTYVFVCRSGGRSGEATRIALSKGFKSAYNMQGGMLAWNDFGFKVER